MLNILKGENAGVYCVYPHPLPLLTKKIINMETIKTNNESMNYLFFLFTQLYNEIVGIQYEYDLFFADLQILFEEYNFSEFNNEKLPDYECMVNFLRSKERAIAKDCCNRGLCIETEI